MSGHTAADEPQASTAVRIVTLVLPILAVLGVLIAAFVYTRNPALEPVGLGPVPAPKAQSAACTSLRTALPADLGDYRSAQLRDPAPAGAQAWRRPDGGEPVVLRCGVERPLDFVVGAGLQQIDSVQWFQATGDGLSTWYAVDRGVYVALTLPDDSGPTPLQDVGAAIAKSMPAQPLDPGAAR